MTTFEKMKAQMQNIAEQAYPNLKKGWGWACTAAVKCTEWCKRAYQRAKPRVIVGAENIRHWFLGLQPRTRIIVAATTGVLVVGMLGLTIAGMSGSGGQSPNVPQASAAVLAMDDTQTEPSDSNIQETVKNDVSKGAEQANEGTVVLAQAASQAARDGAEVPNDDPLVIELKGHTGWVNSVAFSPDGKRIVTGSRDDTARIWDAETGKELQKLEGYASTVNSVAFSPDGKKIVTGSTDGTARIWDIAMSVRQRVNTDEWREAARKAGFIYLSEALQQSGFTRLNDFVQFGTVSLRDNLQRADAFDKAEAEEKIKAALAANAQKTFFGEYTYSTADVQVSGDKSSFTMTIPAGFIAAKVEEVSFPLPNVIGRLDSTHQRAISSIVGYGALTNDGTLRVLSAGDFLNIVTVRRVSDPVLYARYRHNSSNIAITVSGNTDSIRELVRNSSNYQIRMQFTNLKHKSDRRDVEYWRINKDKTPIEVILSGTNDWATRQVIPNPFITTDTETVTTISADILKIEIIKIR